MPNPIIKVVVQAPKDNNWIITLVVTVGVVIVGWIVSYIIEMQKLRIDIEVKAVEEAINLLNERSRLLLT